MDKRCVKEKNWDLKSTGLNLIPFDHRSTDIVAADQKIGFGKLSEWAFARKIGSNVRQSIRTEIAGISLMLGSFTEGN